MKYSIILPSYDPNLIHHGQFLDMIRSIDIHSKGKDYELIIRKNGPSYTESFNDAILSTRGDFIISVQDDMVIEDDEWLEKLSDKDHFVSTKMIKYQLDGKDTPYWPIFGMPRWIFNKVGLLDPIYKDGICYEDNDYVYRMRELGIPIKIADVRYKHYGGKFGEDYLLEKKHDMIIHNAKIFIHKWEGKGLTLANIA